MAKKIFILFFITLFVSCKVHKNFTGSNQYVFIYKFLYNNDYSFPQTEESFWINGENESEFAIYKYKGLAEDQLLEFIYSQKLAEPENSSNNIFWYNFAFVFPNKDTIYSNERLDQWKIKRNGKVEYYSGPDVNSPEMNKEFCEFFSLNNFFFKNSIYKFSFKRLGVFFCKIAI